MAMCRMYGCERVYTGRFLFCSFHWKLISKAIRNKIYPHLMSHGEVEKWPISYELQLLVQEAIDYLEKYHKVTERPKVRRVKQFGP